MSDYSCRHCVSAVGFGGGGLGAEEESGLSPEPCYGCKTNGHQKKSVRRRHTSKLTLVKDVRIETIH